MVYFLVFLHFNFLFAEFFSLVYPVLNCSRCSCFYFVSYVNVMLYLV